MKSKQHGELLVDFVITLVLLIIVAVISVAWSSYQCGVKWEDSGMKSEYRIGAGCMVQRPDGKWLPASSLRDTSL